MIATVLIWKVTLDLAPAHVHLFVCTRRVGSANCGASKDNLPPCGVGAEGAEKILGYLTSTFEDFLHFCEVSEDKID